MIKDFVNKLALCNSFTDVENQYASEFKYSQITRNNLIKYLEVMYQIKPSIMLIGEAPGYNGCRWSGIPFTAEKNIKIEYKKGLLFGIENGFQLRDSKNPQSEASATIVWNYLHEAEVYPLIWNAFPFHPHKAYDKETNRTPKANEIYFGKEIMEELIKTFCIKHIVSVGNIAYTTLNSMGIKSAKVRHPANGGKAEFVSGLSNEFKNHPTTAST
jgi:uracil-DNA glycosylase